MKANYARGGREGLRKRDEWTIIDTIRHPERRKMQGVDTTHITIDEQIEIVLRRARELCKYLF
jgi:hypothetical protein